MKKTFTYFTLVIAAILVAGQSFAQNYRDARTDADDTYVRKESWKPRKAYINFGYVTQELKNESGEEGFKSEYGYSLNMGTTFWLHKPILNRLTIGIDWTYLDVNYVDYGKPAFTDGSDIYTLKYFYQAELGMQVGPTVDVRLLGNGRGGLHAKAYARWAPSASAVLNGGFEEDENAELNGIVSYFNQFYVIGANVSWKAFTVGYEYRWGNSEYTHELYKEDGNFEFEKMDDTSKLKTSSSRIYVGFRF